MAASAGPARSNANHKPVHFVFTVNRNGEPVEAWTQWDELFQDGRGPHQVGIHGLYDPEHHVWVVDDMRHQIFKFSNDGKKLLLTLGESESSATNDDPGHFRRPTDIAFVKDGFVLRQRRVWQHARAEVRQGRQVRQDVGDEREQHPGSVRHASTPSRPIRNGRVYVADRSNDRIQIFDSCTASSSTSGRTSVQPVHSSASAKDGYAWIFFSGVLNEFSNEGAT